MGLELVTSGKNLPEEINVVIEIPKDSEPVKYEVDKASGAVFVDRILSTPMHRGRQDAVDEDRAAGLVHFVLDRLRVLGDLDDDVDFFRQVLAGGDQFQAHARSSEASAVCGGRFYAFGCCGAATLNRPPSDSGARHSPRSSRAASRCC